MTSWARNISACPLVAVRGRSRADIAAGAAIVRIGIQEGARSVAVDGARNTVVSTKSADACDGLVGRRRATVSPATSTVVDVGVEIGAMTAAAAPAGGAADVASAGPADAAGVAVARPTDLEALRLLRLIAAFTERCARVGPLRPRGVQPQRAQHCACENCPQPAQ